MSNDSQTEADAFMSEVCWHYFFNELTQAEIASRMGVTRLRVNQAIQRARSGGMVRVELESPFLSRLELQDRLIRRFGLMNAVVAPADPERYDHHIPTGAALAHYIADRLRNDAWQRVGVSWGMTLQAAIDRMARSSHPDLEIISMIGGTSRGDNFNSFGIASGLANRLGAHYSLLAAPVFLAPQVDRAAFLAQEIFTDHYDKLNRLDAAIITAGDISNRSYLISTGLPGGTETTELTKAGVVGEIVGQFLDASGQVVPTRLDDSRIGIDLDVLRRVPERVLAAAGAHKITIMRGVLTAGMANVVVTDDVTAAMLLEDDK